MIGRRSRFAALPGIAFAAGLLVAVLAAAAFLSLTEVTSRGGCDSAATGVGASSVLTLGRSARGVVGASEYGGPGDSSSGVIGSSGVNLLRDPDSYAELGGYNFATALAMGGLPYGTPLRITWSDRSVIAYKRDIGLGGGPVDGLPRVIDLWWELAGRLGIPYEDGEWSGPVRIQRPPATGAGNQLGAVAPDVPGASGSGCAPRVLAGVPMTASGRAVLLPDGTAAAPVDAPAAVKAMIAAGNQIAGKPYVYGGGHGLPLSEIAPGYDCSSSVDHILYGGGLLPVSNTWTSSELETFGRPGPGRWVTIYANPDHVFMYVAGLRWDTHNAAGPADGSTGIGWHPLVRDAAGFVARHPMGL